MRARIATAPAVALTLFTLLCSCSKGRDTNFVPPGSPMAESIRFQYAVYMLPAPPAHAVDTSVVLHEVLRKYADLKPVDEIPKEPQAMLIHSYVQKNVKKEYAPPDMKSLQHFGRGISRDQAQALQDSDQALILEFGHPKKHVWTALRTATALVEQIARETGGLVWDEETREVFSPDAWHQQRLASWVAEVPELSSQTVIHAYNTGESVRAITLGMSKMGLPDVVVEDSGWSSNNQVGNLINLFCQSIAEGEQFGKTGEFKLVLRKVKNSNVRDSQLKSLKANASGVACLTLRPGKWEEGDPENRLIRLASDKYPGSDVHAKQDGMLSSFFGWEDSVAKIHHNEELLAASAKAKAKLPELQKTFAAGLEPGEFIEVKAPFRTLDGGNEWMWVELTSWKGGKIEGLLQNEPVNVPNLHTGQKVEVRQEDVFDYIRQFADKRTEGNVTGDIIRKMNEDTSKTATPIAQPVVPACDAD
jgi:uncharacterized protein YegJ (DUF2314 family)